MVDRVVLCVTWRVIPADPPLVWRHCRQCGGAQAFHCAGKFRTNLQKKQVDVWLIYRCGVCNQTWNCPVHERCRIGDIGQDAFEAFCSNAPDAVRRFAMDVDWLTRRADRVLANGDVRVEKSPAGRPVGDPDGIEIHLVANGDAGVRLDRLLAAHLGLSRSVVRRLARTGRLTASSGDVRRGVRGPAVIAIDLGAVDGSVRSALVSAAVG